MNPRRAKVFRIKTNKKNHIIKVDITYSKAYSKGGMSFWDYRRYPEGFYFNVQPVEVQPASEGILSYESYVMGTGAQGFIEAGTRFNARRLNDICYHARWNKGENLPNFLEILKKICERDGFNFDTLEFDNR